jgi:hypothetical protein
MKCKLATLAVAAGLTVAGFGFAMSNVYHADACRAKYNQQVETSGYAVDWGKVLDENEAGRVPAGLSTQQLAVLYPQSPTECTWEGEKRAQTWAIIYGFIASALVYLVLAGFRWLINAIRNPRHEFTH